MITEDKIKENINDILETCDLRNVCNEGQTEMLRKTLHLLYSGLVIYERMNETEKKTLKSLQKKIEPFFVSRIRLKERKRRKDKKNFPPHPLYKEKEVKEKAEETLSLAERDFLTISEELTNRRNIFWQQCLARREKYDENILTDFFNYWSEENKKSGKMRFEFQKTWNLDKRLARWATKSYTSSDTLARIRLKKAKQKIVSEAATTQQQSVIAAEREQANAAREEQQEESKKNQMLTDEYIRTHPDSFMAKCYRERQAREAKNKIKS